METLKYTCSLCNKPMVLIEKGFVHVYGSDFDECREAHGYADLANPLQRETYYRKRIAMEVDDEVEEEKPAYRTISRHVVVWKQ